MRPATEPLVAAVVALLCAAAPAAAAEVEPWDGTNPFRCELQQAGFGASGPDPDADPYCVEFDKRRQNVTELGIVDFIVHEPARVAAAGEKCFYFQSDRWRGAVVQDDGTTQLHEWDGHYFFDRARGEGGAWVTNFSVNGRAEDPSAMPGMPPEYAQHMGPGTGGVRVRGSVEADPRCVERARHEGDRIYAADERGHDWATSDRCRAPRRGRVTNRRIGPVRIGDSESRVRRHIGAPAEVRRGYLRYCRGGRYLVGQRRDRSGDLGVAERERTVIIIARGGFRLRGVGSGSSLDDLCRAFSRVALLGRHRGTFVVRPRGSRVLFGVHRGRVRFVAVYDPDVIRTPRRLRGYLRRANVVPRRH